MVCTSIIFSVMLVLGLPLLLTVRRFLSTTGLLIITPYGTTSSRTGVVEGLLAHLCLVILTIHSFMGMYSKPVTILLVTELSDHGLDILAPTGEYITIPSRIY